MAKLKGLTHRANVFALSGSGRQTYMSASSVWWDCHVYSPNVPAEIVATYVEASAKAIGDIIPPIRRANRLEVYTLRGDGSGQIDTTIPTKKYQVLGSSVSTTKRGPHHQEVYLKDE